LALTLLTGIVAALPTTGDATLVGSNNFTVPVTGASGYAYVIWGQSAGNNNWISDNVSVSGGAADVLVWGSPLIGGRTVYFKACDATGCGAEKTTTIAAVTPLPVPTYGDALRRITASHFGFINITAEMPTALTTTGAPVMLFWAIIYVAVFAGLWLRTRTVRLSLIVGFLCIPFIVNQTTGLMLGMPVSFQILINGMMAAAIAGAVYGFVKK
jgi:hypothetical protein